MVYLKVRTRKGRRLGVAVIAVMCGSLVATLCLAVAQTSNPNQKKVALIIHARDQGGNPVAPDSMKDILVMEHGRKLPVVDGPKSAGS